MSALNILRFTAKNGSASEVDYLESNGPFSSSDPRALAWRIASETVNQLIQFQVLAREATPKHLSAYRTYLTESPESLSILHFVFPLQTELLAAQRRLATFASISVWEIAERIVPAAQFYRAHPEIRDACRQCGAVILDATTPATFTTGSVNPLAGKNLATWIRSALSLDKADQRSPFCFHVAIPPQQWPSIARTHFGA
jgi:hypothetical protein